MSKYDEMARGIVSKIKVFSEARSEIQKSKQEFWRDEMARLERSITKALAKVAEPLEKEVERLRNALMVYANADDPVYRFPKERRGDLAKQTLTQIKGDGNGKRD